MAARDAVKCVPEITRNHCPNSAKCAMTALQHRHDMPPTSAHHQLSGITRATSFISQLIHNSSNGAMMPGKDGVRLLL